MLTKNRGATKVLFKTLEIPVIKEFLAVAAGGRNGKKVVVEGGQCGFQVWDDGFLNINISNIH